MSTEFQHPHDLAVRMLRHSAPLLPVLALFLGLGIAIYHFADHRDWSDSFLNAAMLLGGMGPVGEMNTTAGKWLAGLYALACGLVFIVFAGVTLTPVVHDAMDALSRRKVDAETP